MKHQLIILSGPTGIGKTEISIKIARHFNAEIISCDSRQIYKELKIGTAAPGPKELSRVKHHLAGHLSINDYYNVYMFEQDTLRIINKLSRKSEFTMMTGGTGLYIDAIINGIDEMPDIDQEIREKTIKKYEENGIESLRFELKKLDPDYYQKVDLKNHKRIMRAVEVCLQTGKPFSSFRKKVNKERPFDIRLIGLERPRAELYDRINRRVDIMVEEGLIEEAKSFYPYKGLNALNTVGYKELFAFFDGEITLEEAIELIKRNSRRYAKRQITWLKRYPEIEWFHADDADGIIQTLNPE